MGVKNRILMLLENAPYPWDGRVRREAAALMDAGFHVTILCPKYQNQPTLEVEGNLRILRYYPPKAANTLSGYLIEYSYSICALFVLSLYIWIRYGFDIIHAHQPPDTSYLIACFFRLFGKKYVMDHHDLAPELYKARFGSNGKTAVLNLLLWFERQALHCADRVIATNESYLQLEVKRGGVPVDKITIVRNGPELKGSLLDWLEPPSKPSGSPIVLGYIGVMNPQDGVDHLLRAVNILINELGVQDVTCLLIGMGDSLKDLKELSKNLGLEQYVRFVGWLDDPAEIQAYLRSIDIGLSPEPLNQYNNFSTFIKVMDYMAAGKPLAAYDLAETRYSAGESAIYSAANDERDFARAIKTLIDDPERRAWMGRLGRKRVVEQLAWQHQARNLVDMYFSLVPDGELAKIKLHMDSNQEGKS